MWRWPLSRNAIVREIIANTPLDLLPDQEEVDKVIWLLTPSGFYSAQSAWEALRSKASKVSWFHVVWHQRFVPHWSFILWVAILGRLATRDRLMAQGILNDRSCTLCTGGLESDGHLSLNVSMLLRPGLVSGPNVVSLLLLMILTLLFCGALNSASKGLFVLFFSNFPWLHPFIISGRKEMVVSFNRLALRLILLLAR